MKAGIVNVLQKTKLFDRVGFDNQNDIENFFVLPLPMLEQRNYFKVYQNATIVLFIIFIVFEFSLNIDLYFGLSSIINCFPKSASSF